MISSRISVLCLIIMWSISLNCLLSAQNDQILDTLIKYSGGLVSSEEFLNRVNFSYPMKRGSATPDSIKKEFLYSLIAEKLWAREAKEQGLDTVSALNDSWLPLYRIHVLDELYREEIESKVHITDEDVVRGAEKFRQSLKVVVYSAESPELIRTTRNSLLKKSVNKLPAGVNTTQEPITVIFGQIEDEAIEDSVYRLPADSLSIPLHANGKWFLFKMITKEPTDISGRSNEALLMNVKQIVRRRRASFFENKFRDSLFGALRIETDAPLFKLTAKTIAKILIERYKAPDWDTTKAVTLFQDDAAIIQKQIGTKKLDSPFILFKEHPLTLREALRYLPFKPIELKHPTNKKISTILQDFFRYVIEQEVLYREALKRGISDNQNVTERANLWKENLLASLYSAKIWKTVNDEAEKAGEPVYYDVVSVKSIATLLDLLRQMKNGQPFDSIYANNKGFAIPDDSPLFTPKVKELLDGQMKAPLHSNPPGVYGPFESGGNYILLQKRSPKKLMPERISSAPGIRRQQLQHKYEEKMEGITAKLFSKYAVSVNSEVFEKITINGLNTFTVQYLGFGNKLPAFPMTAPYSQWIKRLPAGQLP